jgi:beta-lactam-binding protein with PASTA domain
MGLFDRSGFNLRAVEDYVAAHLRLFIPLTMAAVVLAGLTAAAVFFAALRGEEQTMVPDVRNKDLTEALLELQVKELYPRIQLRYAQSAGETKGLILEQDPRPGAIVKAGRRIRLVVSQGAVINTVENYRGRNINEVRMDLQTLFASAAQPLLSLREPFMYEYADAAPGTILEQRPEPGAPIAGPTALEFVVSRGPEDTMITVPKLTGLSLEQALEEAGKSSLRVVFSQRPVRGREAGKIVVYQDPPAETVTEADQEIAVLVTAPPELPPGEVFDLFSYTLPQNPYPLLVRLELILPDGERREIVALEHPGGRFVIPYQAPAGSVLVLSMLNRELHREEVKLPLDSLYPDQL